MAEESFRSFVATGRSAPAPPPARTWAASSSPAAGATSTAAAPAPSGVRYGDIIELTHKMTNKMLSASDQPFRHDRSSRQPMVFGAEPAKNDPHSQWRVTGPYGLWDLRGELVQDGSIVTLVNVRTGGALHSHDVPAPNAGPPGGRGHGQREVTCFVAPNGGGLETHDQHDNWNLDTMGHSTTWQPGTAVRLWHTQSKNTLHSHFGNFPINDKGEERQEITALPGTTHDDGDLWVVNIVRSKPPAAVVPKVPVCFGDVIRLRHVYCGYAPQEIHYLTAHPFHCYHHDRSSRQHQVTASLYGPHQEWTVMPAHDVDIKSVYGKQVPHDAVIRLVELESEEPLHSHNAPAPANAGFTEMTTLPTPPNPDDNFRVSTEDKQGWTSLTYVRFTHVNTNKTLSSARNQVHELVPGSGVRRRSAHGMDGFTEHGVWTTVPSPAMYIRSSAR